MTASDEFHTLIRNEIEYTKPVPQPQVDGAYAMGLATIAAAALSMLA